ncbi:MAG TPA: N-acetyltransferase [Syntrophobacteraceae bacterium]|nr:N-acetyltransferase [Syntrophobacteraceae bacterium]
MGKKVSEMICKARIGHVPMIQQLLGAYAREGKLLARSLSELYTNLRDLMVAVDEESDTILGCCGLHVIWDNLAEIRSLAVQESCQGRGIGRRLVEACIVEAGDLGIGRLFTLTYEAAFFERLGFRIVDKDIFPHKIWVDCLHCPKFPNCDEVALVLDLSEQPGTSPLQENHDEEV